MKGLLSLAGAMALSLGMFIASVDSAQAHRYRHHSPDRGSFSFEIIIGSGARPRGYHCHSRRYCHVHSRYYDRYDDYYDGYYRPRIRYRTPRYRTGLSGAHYRWCEARYRSYRAYDNTFQPYHGPRKACVSPYY